MTPPLLPTPALGDAPNIPTDLANVAQGIENQALAAYAAYNTSNNPSATTLESRISAVDAQPGGTAAGLDTQITTLNTSINNTTATGNPSSSLSVETARTAAFPARQNGHDTLMTTINSNLSTYEPQIATLRSQRPLGVIVNNTVSYSLPVTVSPVVVTYATLTGRASAYVRATFTGTFLNTSAAGARLTLLVTLVSGTSPSTGGNLVGQTSFSIPTTGYFPISVAGLEWGFTAGSQYTFSIVASLSSGSNSGNIAQFCTFILEDLGWKYY